MNCGDENRRKLDIQINKLISANNINLSNKINKIEEINQSLINRIDNLEKEIELLKLKVDLTPPGIFEDEGGKLYQDSKLNFDNLNKF